MNYVVYILYSEVLKGYYVGQTNNIVKRVETHNCGGKKYTSKGVPWTLIKTFDCVTHSEALQLEKRIKKRGIRRYLEKL